MNNAKIQFSIIMPCYNSSAYVTQAVESLLNQTYPNWELIAVNDGSKDDTLKILNEFAGRDGRIKVFSKPNGGYATAINFGLERVSGDYFLMMGSDDKLSANLFSDIVGDISEREELPDMIGFRAVKFKNGAYFQRDSVSNFDSTAEMSDVSVAEFEKQYPKNAAIFFERDTAKCFKTSKLEELRYFGKFGYDSDGVFSTLFAHKCRSFLTLPIDGYLWTIRDGSVSSKVNPKINIDRLKVWMKYLSAVSRDQMWEPANKEKKFVLYPFVISADWLGHGEKFSLQETMIMHRALRKSIRVAKKKGVGLGIYYEIYEGNPIKRNLFSAFPLVWLKRHGFVRPTANKK